MARRAAFTLIELMIVIAIIAIIAAIAIPNLIAARKHSNETAAIGALKTIGSAESIFREGDKDGNGVLDYGALSQLSATQLIDSVLGSGLKQGYIFGCGPSLTTSEFMWGAQAAPVVPRTTGDRYFCENHTCVIYYTTAGIFATTGSPGIDPSTCQITGGLPVGK